MDKNSIPSPLKIIHGMVNAAIATNAPPPILTICSAPMSHNAFIAPPNNQKAGADGLAHVHTSGEVDEAELDMLDLAFDPQPTSRLGCQVLLSPDLEGLVVHLPAGVHNMMDFIPFDS